MNLLQIKQKMFELGISERYMAEACGVGERYLKQCLNGNKSHPMSKLLQQKIEILFHTLDIRKAKEERVGLKEPFEPEPSPTMVYGPDVDRRNKEKEQERQLEECFKQEPRTKDCEYMIWQYEIKNSRPKHTTLLHQCQL